MTPAPRLGVLSVTRRRDQSYGLLIPAQALGMLIATDHGRLEVVVLTPARTPGMMSTQGRVGMDDAKGLRPVMLGLGGAWTGIDLTDPSVPPERDNLLTDLVIVRMPVGLNRTNSALARIERSGTASISNEALLTFKQGLGRLIRRTGVTDRRIWILDGRIFGSWNRMPQLTGAARRLLREYVHQHTF